VQNKPLGEQLSKLIFLLWSSLGSLHAAAVDFALTGFGTVGYAVSDKDFQYLRYIDNDGTFKADSLLGVQVEARLSPAWGVTVQGVASAPRTRDEGYETKIRWAFLSYRPTNDWLIRAGRLRPPFFLNSQNAEVGVTYDYARLPAEIYSISPVYDFDGGAVTKTWFFETSELNADVFWGKSELSFRLPFQRDPVQASRIPRFFPEKVTAKGVVLTRSAGPLLIRGGFHQATLRPESEQLFFEALTPTSISGPSPLGGTLFLPSFVSKLELDVLILGADWRPGDWRITGEVAHTNVKHSDLGVDSTSGYISVARAVGKWTPYATYARILSAPPQRRLYQQVNATPVPAGAQGPPLFLPANFHQILSDSIFVFDQYSTMVGASYTFSPTSKVKVEWMRTHVGVRSTLVDGDVHNRSFNVFSLSYSVAF
jgi:hypothetical protein